MVLVVARTEDFLPLSSRLLLPRVPDLLLTRISSPPYAALILDAGGALGRGPARICSYREELRHRRLFDRHRNRDQIQRPGSRNRASCRAFLRDERREPSEHDP